MEGDKVYKVHATPTFIVTTTSAQTEKIEGAHNLADFDKALSKHVK
jgi:hypothetical protein